MKNKKIKIGIISILVLAILSISLLLNNNNNKSISNNLEIESVDDAKSNKEIDLDEKSYEKENIETEKENIEKENAKKENTENENIENEKLESENSSDSQVSSNDSTEVQENNNQEAKKEENQQSENQQSESKPTVDSNPTAESKAESEAESEPIKKYVTISITCETILNNLDKLEESKKDIIPQNGVILGKKQIEIEDGDTVFDVLLRETRKQRIHMDFIESPVYNSAYIKGISNIYEFDAGELSGWKYSVNGVFPNYGSSQYDLKDGDIIEWRYTCDLGRDL